MDGVVVEVQPRGGVVVAVGDYAGHVHIHRLQSVKCLKKLRPFSYAQHPNPE